MQLNISLTTLTYWGGLRSCHGLESVPLQTGGVL